MLFRVTTPEIVLFHNRNALLTDKTTILPALVSSTPRFNFLLQHERDAINPQPIHVYAQNTTKETNQISHFQFVEHSELNQKKKAVLPRPKVTFSE
jgi:hypothetical protein